MLWHAKQPVMDRMEEFAVDPHATKALKTDLRSWISTIEMA